MDQCVRPAYYVKNLPTPNDNRGAIAGVLTMMRNAPAPFGTADPARPNISTTIWRTVADQTNGVYYFESTTSPELGVTGGPGRLLVSRSDGYDPLYRLRMPELGVPGEGGLLVSRSIGCEP
jgi:penicillin V acylase-like amidase (Ntn superfamily)